MAARSARRPGAFRRSIHAGVVSAGMLPALGLLVAALTNRLGADPIETLLHETGQWTLRLLLVTLSVTPLRRLLAWSAIAPFRRSFGLLTFFYALLHFTTYTVLDLELDLGAFVEDVAERPYITVGLSAFLLLIPLAATSTRGMVRRLGRRWKTLHRAVYVAAICGVVHFFWGVKADLREPLLYGGALAVLLGLRLLRRLELRPRRRAARTSRILAAPSGVESEPDA